MRSWLLLVALTGEAHAARRPAAPPPDLDGTVAQLVGAALASDEAYEELRRLCDDIGARPSGSAALAEAVAWGAERMREDGLSVTLEAVEVPVWDRGAEALTLLGARPEPLPLLALGGSVATPPEGIEADVLVVSDAAELDRRATDARGRIVVWDVPFTTYGETVRYRVDGASLAARAGAVASLVRSVTPVSLRTPHTGMMRYAEDAPKIPSAAISIEDAARLHRLQDDGRAPRLRLTLGARTLPQAPSHNVVGELRGRELPGEIVTLGCHLDSWDVGQGAQDDGAGCVAVMEAAALIRSLPTPPRRTVRVVLFTNEESGLRGGREHAARRAGERIVAAVEDDTGSGAPLGFRAHLPGHEDPKTADIAALRATIEPHLEPLRVFGAQHLRPAWSGADIGPLVAQGTLGFGLEHDEAGYWPVHHTEADTFDKVDPLLMRRNVAALAALAWVLAEHPGPIPGVAR